MKPLPNNPLPTLADEIARALPGLLARFPSGPLAPAVAEHIAADVASVRRAFESLESDGRAKIVRRGRALHLVAPDYPGRICIICRVEFRPVAKKTRTCSHSCARHLAWQNEEMRARHRASVKRAKADPESREHFSKINKARCSTPEWRAKMSDQNRRSWKDPESRARRLMSIEEAWRGEKAAERVAKARNKKLALWSDPEWRRKTCEAMRVGKRGRFKRAVLTMVVDRPESQPEDIAPCVGLSAEQVKIIWRKALKDGELTRRPKDGRKGRKQSPELVAKRIASIRKNRAAKEACRARTVADNSCTLE